MVASLLHVVAKETDGQKYQPCAVGLIHSSPKNIVGIGCHNHLGIFMEEPVISIVHQCYRIEDTCDVTEQVLASTL